MSHLLCTFATGMGFVPKTSAFPVALKDERQEIREKYHVGTLLVVKIDQGLFLTDPQRGLQRICLNPNPLEVTT